MANFENDNKSPDDSRFDRALDFLILIATQFGFGFLLMAATRYYAPPSTSDYQAIAMFLIPVFAFVLGMQLGGMFIYPHIAKGFGLTPRQ